MTLPLRRMKKYHPRRSSKEIKLNKQKLIDLEHQIKSDMGELFLFLKEGSKEDILRSSKKTKTDLLKLGPDMEKVAADIGGRLPKIVYHFLHTIDTILPNPNNSMNFNELWFDESKIRSCYVATQKLEDALS